MNIALDYDDTYTRDPNLWLYFMGMCKARGHEVRIVTIRKPEMKIDWDSIHEGYQVPVIYTSGVQKREYCTSIGWNVDIWIDDSPEFIVSNNTVILNPKEGPKA